MADPEEGLCSGVQACNDPLRGICCKAHCRTAEGGAESHDDYKMKIFNHMLMKYLKKILEFNFNKELFPTCVLESCGWLSRSASILVRESISASILE